MLQLLGRLFKRAFYTSHEQHPGHLALGGKTRRKVQVFVNGRVPLSGDDLRIMRKKRSFKTKGVEVVFDCSLSESSDIILNIEIPDFAMDDEEDPQPDDNSSSADPSNPCQTSTSCPPGTSTTAPPAALPFSHPSSSATPAASSSKPCPLVPHSLGHSSSSFPNIPPPPEDSIPLCQAGFRTRAFRKPESPKSVAPAPGGATRWYYTTGPCLLPTPPSRASDLEILERGDLYLHEDTRSAQFQAWMWDGAGWGRTEEGVPHPVLGDKRRLWFRFVKEEGRYEPNWIVRGSWNRYKSTRRQEIDSGLPASPMFKAVNARVRN